MLLLLVFERLNVMWVDISSQTTPLSCPVTNSMLKSAGDNMHVRLRTVVYGETEDAALHPGSKLRNGSALFYSVQSLVRFVHVLPAEEDSSGPQRPSTTEEAHGLRPTQSEKKQQLQKKSV